MKFTVAIDGPAAAGKGTISKRVATHFGFAHLDTGLIYRATGARVLSGEDPIKAAEHLRVADLERDDLRTSRVADAASKVAAIAEVRAALMQFQKDFAKTEGGAVLDGRDIGTVICPDADVKLFVTASDEIRAERRYLELSDRGAEVTREEVLAEVRERDARDRGRLSSPLRPASDATEINTSEMDIEAAVARAIELIEAAR